MWHLVSVIKFAEIPQWTFLPSMVSLGPVVSEKIEMYYCKSFRTTEADTGTCNNHHKNYTKSLVHIGVWSILIGWNELEWVVENLKINQATFINCLFSSLKEIPVGFFFIYFIHISYPLGFRLGFTAAVFPERSVCWPLQNAESRTI